MMDILHWWLFKNGLPAQSRVDPTIAAECSDSHVHPDLPMKGIVFILTNSSTGAPHIRFHASANKVLMRHQCCFTSCDIVEHWCDGTNTNNNNNNNEISIITIIIVVI
jgi:hypothetical protein